jgi:hypothetical protein
LRLEEIQATSKMYWILSIAPNRPGFYALVLHCCVHHARQVLRTRYHASSTRPLPRGLTIFYLRYLAPGFLSTPGLSAPFSLRWSPNVPSFPVARRLISCSRSSVSSEPPTRTFGGCYAVVGLECCDPNLVQVARRARCYEPLGRGGHGGPYYCQGSLRDITAR